MPVSYIPRCPCSHYTIRLHDRTVHIVAESMAESGRLRGGTFIWVEVCRIWLGESRDRHWDVVWLDDAAPHKHMVVNITVTTSARTNSKVPTVGGPLPLPGGLAPGAQQSKLDADIHTSPSIGTPSIQIVHIDDYCIITLTSSLPPPLTKT
jgi:hypothetical protein